MKRILAILVAVGLVALGTATLASADNGPEEIKLPAKMGDVTFPHKAHQEKIDDCTKCHHKGVEAGACSSCHDGEKAPKAKDAFHKLCKDCHKAEGAPTGCKDCHKK
jgi:Class III cytochrome C family